MRLAEECDYRDENDTAQWSSGGRLARVSSPLSTDDDSLLPCPCAGLAGLVDVVQTKHVFGRKLVVVDRVICSTKSETRRPTVGGKPRTVFDV